MLVLEVVTFRVEVKKTEVQTKGMTFDELRFHGSQCYCCVCVCVCVCVCSQQILRIK